MTLEILFHIKIGIQSPVFRTQKMLVSSNPTPQEIAIIISQSKHLAAKWIREESSGNLWYWPAEQATHTSVAHMVGAVEYSKGISIKE